MNPTTRVIAGLALVTIVFTGGFVYWAVTSSNASKASVEKIQMDQLVAYAAGLESYKQKVGVYNADAATFEKEMPHQLDTCTHYSSDVNLPANLKATAPFMKKDGYRILFRCIRKWDDVIAINYWSLETGGVVRGPLKTYLSKGGEEP